MSRGYDDYLVDLLNEDPDYVVDVLGLSSWELVTHFPKRVQRFIEEEYGVRPEDSGDFQDPEEEDRYGDDEEEEWTFGGQEDDD